MSLNSINVGDLVICVESSGYLVRDRLYTVSRIENEFIFTTEEPTNGNGMYRRRFKALNEFHIEVGAGDNPVSRAVQTILFEHGLKWICSGKTFFDGILDNDCLQVVSSNNTLCNVRPTEKHQVFTVDQLGIVLEILRYKKTAQVKLNDTYTAKVSADSIVVGCQTFPVAILDQLIAAHQKITGGTTPNHGLRTDYVLLGKGGTFKVPDGYTDFVRGAPEDAAWRRKGDKEWTYTKASMLAFSYQAVEYASHKDSKIVKLNRL